MDLSAPNIKQIQDALSTGNFERLDTLVTDLSGLKGKNDRVQIQNAVNIAVAQDAIRTDKPEFLAALHEISQENAEEILSLVLVHFISTKKMKWFPLLLDLPEKLGKKSLQSQMLAAFAFRIISEGITHSDVSLINRGIETLNKITFKKYKSEAIIECLPSLLKWTERNDNTEILASVKIFVREITDVSKCGIIHAEIAETIAAIAIHKKDWSLYKESIQFGSAIRQKLRRKECFVNIIGAGISSDFKPYLTDARKFIQNFHSLPDEVQDDIISALTIQLFCSIKNKDQIDTILKDLCTKPFARQSIVHNLLLTGEKNADLWYLSKAMEGLLDRPPSEKIPIREIVRVGTAIARQSRSSGALIQLVPFIEKNCSKREAADLFLQFADIMVHLRNFDEAKKLFGKIPNTDENAPQYTSVLAKLLKEGVLHDLSSAQFKEILEDTRADISRDAISRAGHEISHEAHFTDITKHCNALIQLLDLHPGYDSLILDSITIMISRKYLDSWDSSLLVNLSRSIKDPAVREQALSIVVIKLAEIGVRVKNRDLLQQAVGITCLIEGQATRSATLSSIIDDATLLAATQGDLDLLLRMKIWSSSLLDHSLVAFAMTNIVNGVIKYAIGKQTPEALDEAYVIARDIEDPVLKMQLCEHIAESYVRIGCALLSTGSEGDRSSDIGTALVPFQTGLQILKGELSKPRISLKIAGMIDIILFSSKKSSISDFLLPLALYSLEIEDPLERSAMVSRIVANLNTDLFQPDSADPNVVLAYDLLVQYQEHPTPETIDIIYRLLYQIRDPFVRAKGLCMLADSSLRSGNQARAGKILDEICPQIPELLTGYLKVLVLADLTRGYARIDPEKAKHCLEEGLQYVNTVENENSPVARRQMISAIVNMQDILSDDRRIDIILTLFSGLSDPEEYVRALLEAELLIRKDKNTCNMVLREISESVKHVEPAYDQVLLLLDVLPFATKNCDNDVTLDILKTAESYAKKCNIPYIADTLRAEMAKALSVLADQHNDPRYLAKSSEILDQIEDEEVRFMLPVQKNTKKISETDKNYSKTREFSIEVINGGSQSAQVSTLERMLRRVTDRAKRAGLFCSISLLFREKGDIRTSKRLLNSATKEAGAIRPLSKRAYVQCDMAMRLYSAGYGGIAQDILDNAIDAATNIRQATLRDDVFNEMGVAIKMMQGMHG